MLQYRKAVCGLTPRNIVLIFQGHQFGNDYVIIKYNKSLLAQFVLCTICTKYVDFWRFDNICKNIWMENFINQFFERPLVKLIRNILTNLLYQYTLFQLYWTFKPTTVIMKHNFLCSIYKLINLTLSNSRK